MCIFSIHNTRSLSVKSAFNEQHQPSENKMLSFKLTLRELKVDEDKQKACKIAKYMNTRRKKKVFQ